MSPGEVSLRVADGARKAAWRRQQVMPGDAVPLPTGTSMHRTFDTPLPAAVRDQVPEAARADVRRVADEILAGRWNVFGIPRTDIADPDWFLDPASGRRAPSRTYAFDIDHRDESVTGNVKSVWEVSRHHHLTLLAAAWWLSGDERYATTVASQLRSWWAANPFLSGIHWTSGIELGVRLVSWAWIRRLLADWPGAADLFENNDVAVHQIWAHQKYLAGFQSRGSSGNNHAVAEQVGRLVGACAFPWYAETPGWRQEAAEQLSRHFLSNTFHDGLNRELASDYHGFVTELALVAGIEADACGIELGREFWVTLRASSDAAAAIVDNTRRPPRQGDGDEGRGLMIAPPNHENWDEILDLSDRVFGRLDWWPVTRESMQSAVLGGLAQRHNEPGQRPLRRPDAFLEGGQFILRGVTPTGAEIWCRCDSGPHGFGSMSAHGHADALSIELRVDGVDILADPGTYCYHGEPAWRSYFRSTPAHNTLQIDGLDQSLEGGPFMWRTRAVSHLDGTRSQADGSLVGWSAHHEGYSRLEYPLIHHRSVDVDPSAARVDIVDRIETRGTHDVRVYLHLGPDVHCELTDHRALLRWSGPSGLGEAVLELPPTLDWSQHQGEVNPPLGWYSPAFNVKVPAVVMVGQQRNSGPREWRISLHLPMRPGASIR